MPELDYPWIPAALRHPGPAGLAWWQWIGIVAVAVVALVLGRLAAAVLRKLLARAVARSAADWDDRLLDRLNGPLRLFAAVVLARSGLPWVLLPSGPDATAAQILTVLFGLALVWAALGVIDVFVSHITGGTWAMARPSSRALILLGGRIVKAIVLAIALVAVLGGMGVPIASLVAGLGIGGIALAFGAQKTVENLFGAFSLGVDQPLRVGDFVRVEADVLGTVEAVGLRSTRIRTLDRTVVSLPNGRLADMRIETFALRDRCRLATTIGLVYETSAAQLRTVIGGLEQALRDHPAIWPDDVVVRFAGFGPSSLDIEIMAWLTTSDFGEFRTWRQDLLFRFMDVVEHAGSSFAFPTQTIHVAAGSAVPATRDEWITERGVDTSHASAPGSSDRRG